MNYLVINLIYDLTVTVGTAYLVFFHGISPWWWVLAFFLMAMNTYAPRQKK